MSRGGSLLPRDPGGEAWLGAVIGVLCFIACLMAVGALAADRAAHGWSARLRAEATVQVRPRADETGDAAAARAAETLSGVDGVEEAQALDRETAEALLRPWMGEAALEDLPLPHLVTVRLSTESPASAQALGEALAEAGLDASVDDHSLWRGEIERSALTLTSLALAAFALTAGAAGAAITYATRAGIAARRREIEILSLSGAGRGQIIWQFQKRFGRLAALAGAGGGAAAAGLLAAVRLAGGEGGVSPALPLAWSDLVILSLSPVLAATVALAAAWLAARRALDNGASSTASSVSSGAGSVE